MMAICTLHIGMGTASSLPLAESTRRLPRCCQSARTKHEHISDWQSKSHKMQRVSEALPWPATGRRQARQGHGSGHRGIDRVLPWGGLPHGCLHDVTGPPNDGAALGFTAWLTSLLGARGWVLWCRGERRGAARRRANSTDRLSRSSGSICSICRRLRRNR